MMGGEIIVLFSAVSDLILLFLQLNMFSINIKTDNANLAPRELHEVGGEHAKAGGGDLVVLTCPA